MHPSLLGLDEVDGEPGVPQAPLAQGDDLVDMELEEYMNHLCPLSRALDAIDSQPRTIPPISIAITSSLGVFSQLDRAAES